MNTSQDIIGLASDFLASNIDLGDQGNMRSIAQALLEREETIKTLAKEHNAMMNKCDGLETKLKIAVTALEAIDSPHVEKTMWEVTAKKRGIAKEALLRLSPLP